MAANAVPVEGVAIDDETGEEGTSPQLALGLTGDPIEVSAETVGWRVSWRKLGERGGSPSLVYAKGRPLILALDATADELVALVGGRPGRYRLDQVGDDNHVIEGAAPAYAVIERDLSLTAPIVAATGNAMEDLVRQLMQHERELMTTTQAAMKTLQDSFAIQSQQVASVVAACGELVSGSPRRVQIEYPAVPTLASDGQPRKWEQILEALVPAIEKGLPFLLSRLMTKPTVTADAHGNPSVTWGSGNDQ